MIFTLGQNIVMLIAIGMMALMVNSVSVEATGEDSTLNPKDKAYLLNLARQAVCWHLGHQEVPEPDEKAVSENVLKKLGCFVTLNHKTKKLRGCIGTFERSQPLYKNVISRAVAASRDRRFRFDPMTYEELKDIEIEISVLTEPKDLAFDSPEDLLGKLRPLVDGVILRTRYGGSTYLPQVWEQIPDKEDFLSNLCRKHGAPLDTWKRDYRNIRIQIYQAIIFHEKSHGRKVVGPGGAVVGRKGAVLLGAVKPLKEGLVYGGGPVEEGTELAPGAIVTWDSDIVELRR